MPKTVIKDINFKHGLNSTLPLNQVGDKASPRFSVDTREFYIATAAEGEKPILVGVENPVTQKAFEASGGKVVGQIWTEYVDENNFSIVQKIIDATMKHGVAIPHTETHIGFGSEEGDLVVKLDANGNVNLKYGNKATVIDEDASDDLLATAKAVRDYVEDLHNKAIKYKGMCAESELPTTGNENGDYWAVSEYDETSSDPSLDPTKFEESGYAIWNGTTNDWDKFYDSLRKPDGDTITLNEKGELTATTKVSVTDFDVEHTDSADEEWDGYAVTKKYYDTTKDDPLTSEEIKFMFSTARFNLGQAAKNATIYIDLNDDQDFSGQVKAGSLMTDLYRTGDGATVIRRQAAAKALTFGNTEDRLTFETAEGNPATPTYPPESKIPAETDINHVRVKIGDSYKLLANYDDVYSLGGVVTLTTDQVISSMKSFAKGMFVDHVYSIDQKPNSPENSYFQPATHYQYLMYDKSSNALYLGDPEIKTTLRSLPTVDDSGSLGPGSNKVRKNLTAIIGGEEKWIANIDDVAFSDFASLTGNKVVGDLNVGDDEDVLVFKKSRVDIYKYFSEPKVTDYDYAIESDGLFKFEYEERDDGSGVDIIVGPGKNFRKVLATGLDGLVGDITIKPMVPNDETKGAKIQKILYEVSDDGTDTKVYDVDLTSDNGDILVNFYKLNNQHYKIDLKFGNKLDEIPNAMPDPKYLVTAKAVKEYVDRETAARIAADAEIAFRVPVMSNEGVYILRSRKETPSSATTYSWMTPQEILQQALANELDLVYTNLDPSTVAVGGIPRGSTFPELTVQQVFDWMFYPPVEPLVIDDVYFDNDMPASILETKDYTINNVHVEVTKGSYPLEKIVVKYEDSIIASTNVVYEGPNVVGIPPVVLNKANPSATFEIEVYDDAMNKVTRELVGTIAFLPAAAPVINSASVNPREVTTIFNPNKYNVKRIDVSWTEGDFEIEDFAVKYNGEKILATANADYTTFTFTKDVGASSDIFTIEFYYDGGKVVSVDVTMDNLTFANASGPTIQLFSVSGSVPGTMLDDETFEITAVDLNVQKGDFNIDNIEIKNGATVLYDGPYTSAKIPLTTTVVMDKNTQSVTLTATATDVGGDLTAPQSDTKTTTVTIAIASVVKPTVSIAFVAALPEKLTDGDSYAVNSISANVGKGSYNLSGLKVFYEGVEVGSIVPVPGTNVVAVSTIITKENTGGKFTATVTDEKAYEGFAVELACEIEFEAPVVLGGKLFYGVIPDSWGFNAQAAIDAGWDYVTSENMMIEDYITPAGINLSISTTGDGPILVVPKSLGPLANVLDALDRPIFDAFAAPFEWVHDGVVYLWYKSEPIDGGGVNLTYKLRY